MKPSTYLLTLICWLFFQQIFAQNIDNQCFERFLKNGDFALSLRQFEQARSQFNAALECPALTPEQRATANLRLRKIIDEINRDEREARQKAERDAEIARENARKLAEANAKAERAKAQTDSLLVLSKINEKRATGNELGFKALVELRNGDRTAALRLAEFIENNTDPGNGKALEALLAAAYFNNDPRNRDRLGWLLQTLMDKSGGEAKQIVFSNDAERLAVQDFQGDILIFEISSGRSIFKWSATENAQFLAFSPSLQTIAVLANHAQFQLIEVPAGKTIFEKKLTSSAAAALEIITFSADERRVGIVSTDRSVRVFDIPKQSELFQLPADSLRYAVHFSQNLEKIAIATQKKPLKIFSVSSGSAKNLHEAEVYFFAIEFSPDGRWLAAATSDRELLLFSTVSENLAGKFSTQRDVAVSVRQRNYAMRDVSNFSTGAPFKLQFSTDGSRLTAFFTDRTAITFAASEQRGLVLMQNFITTFPEMQDVVGDASGNLVMFEGGDRLEILKLDESSPEAPASQVFFSSIDRKMRPKYLFSPSGRRFAFSMSEGRVTVRNLTTQQNTLLHFTNAEEVKKMVFSPDDRLLAICRENGAVEIWDAIGFEMPFSPVPLAGELLNLHHSPDANLLALLDDTGTLTMVRNADNAILFRKKVALPAPEKPRTAEKPLLHVPIHNLSFEFSADSRRIAVFGKSGKILQRDTIFILNASTGDVAFPLFSAGFANANFCGGGQYFRITNNFSELLFDADSGKPVTAIPQDSCFQIEVSDDGKWIAYKTIRNIGVADATTGRRVFYIKKPSEIVYTLQKTGEELDYFRVIGFSPDGKKLLVQSNFETAQLYNTSDWSMVGILNANANMPLRFSPDSRRVLAETYHYLSVWDASDGRYLVGLPVSGSANAIISGNGQWLAVPQDKQVVIFDFLPMQERNVLRGHRGRITELAFSQDGQWLATAAEDLSIKVWNMNTGREECNLSGSDTKIDFLDFSPDGHHVLASYQNGKICQWVINSEKLLKKIQQTQKIAGLNEDQIYRFNLEQAFLNKTPEAALQNMEAPVQLGFARYFANQAGLSLNPSVYQTLYERADVFYRKAISNLDSDLALRELARLRNDFAVKLRRDQKIADSQTAARRALQIFHILPQNEPQLLVEKGYAHALAGQYDDAKSTFRQALQLNFSVESTIKTRLDFLSQVGDDRDRWENFWDALQVDAAGNVYDWNLGAAPSFNVSAFQQFEQGDYDIAAQMGLMEVLHSLFELHQQPTPQQALLTAERFGNLSWYYLFTKNGVKIARQAALAGLALDSTVMFIHANLGHAALLDNDLETAMSIYDRWKNEWWSDGAGSFLPMRTVILDDLEKLAQAGKRVWHRNIPIAARRLHGENWDESLEKKYMPPKTAEPPAEEATQKSKGKKPKS